MKRRKRPVVTTLHVDLHEPPVTSMSVARTMAPMWELKPEPLAAELDVRLARYEACEGCAHLCGLHCAKAGQFVPQLIQLANAACPVGVW